MYFENAALTDDLGFISEFDEENIECPTCGTLHENSFHARLQLTQDAHAFALLIAELREEKQKAISYHEKLLNQLSDVNKRSQEITATLQEEKVDMKATDLLLAAHSVHTLDNAFEAVTSELSSNISEYAKTVENFKTEYKKYEDKDRLKEVRKYFSDTVSWYSDRLNVPVEEQIKKIKPADRGSSGGSSAPRSLLAVHLGMLRANAEYGDTPFFPFVVDTLQQSGQDLKNLSSMIEILNSAAGVDHQIILAVEMLPTGVDISNFEVVSLSEKRELLNSGDFKEVAFLAERMRMLKDAINKRKAEDRSKSD